MITIVNYGLGNLASIQNMCRKLGIESVITDQAELIEQADRLILPGVGHFRAGMDNLHASGLKPLLDRLVIDEKKPVLGICLGAQLMTRHSEEGDVDGLGWVDADTIAFDPLKLGGLKIPHMGWTDILIRASADPIWEGIPDDPRFYFVHSYHFNFRNEAEVAATAQYGYEFACAFRKDNIYGMQFHPEKSHKYGMRILENFART
jgi:glutamine amidotransferase